MRRVVTGIDENGTSIVVSDDEIEPVRGPVLGGTKNYVLWGADGPQTVPSDGSLESGLSFFPQGTDSFRFHVFSYPPASEVPEPPSDMEAALAETERLLPGITAAVTDESGMHWTASIDLEFVIEGEFVLELDNGKEITLRAGDCVVQCGAKHAWYNRHDGWSTAVLVFIGTKMDESRFAGAQ
jgi:hypothetical protein